MDISEVVIAVKVLTWSSNCISCNFFFLFVRWKFFICPISWAIIPNKASGLGTYFNNPVVRSILFSSITKAFGVSSSINEKVILFFFSGLAISIILEIKTSISWSDITAAFIFVIKNWEMSYGR